MDSNPIHYKKKLLHCAVAAVLGTSGAAAGLYTPAAVAQETSSANDREVEEVVVTGSRIVRRDLEVNSPLLTVDRELFEDSASSRSSRC